MTNKRRITVQAYTKELKGQGIVFTERTIRGWCSRLGRWTFNGARVRAEKTPGKGGWILYVEERGSG